MGQVGEDEEGTHKGAVCGQVCQCGELGRPPVCSPLTGPKLQCQPTQRHLMKVPGVAS